MLNDTSTWTLFGSIKNIAQLMSIRILALARGTASIANHALLVTLSAGIALSLPYLVTAFSQHILSYWAEIEQEKVFLIVAEIAVALALVSFFNFVGRSLKDNRVAEMARGAGLIYFSPGLGRLAQWKARKLKKKQGLARSIMLIGSTGYRTFVDPRGELRSVLENCLEAKIMLLNPESPGAKMRANAIPHQNVTHESLREQVSKSIVFLKQLKGAQKNIKLKLYADPPHLKLAILGDYIWLRHYHTSLDVLTMPEYGFKHNQNDYGLYTLFYQYFIRRWESPEIPEYDLETDELVFGGNNGEPVIREKVAWVEEWKNLSAQERDQPNS